MIWAVAPEARTASRALTAASKEGNGSRITKYSRPSEAWSRRTMSAFRPTFAHFAFSAFALASFWYTPVCTPHGNTSGSLERDSI